MNQRDGHGTQRPTDRGLGLARRLGSGNRPGMADSGFQERLGAAAAIPGVTLMAESNVMRRLV